MARKLFVGSLNYRTSEDALARLFGEFGNVVSTKIVTDRETGKSRGFGFVEMETEEQGNSAISKLNDTEFEGRKIIVMEAKPQQGGGGGGGRNGGGGNRGGGGGGGRRNFF